MRKLLTFLWVVLLASSAFATPRGTTRTATLEAISGNTYIQANTALNMGVDDTGYDLKCFGATSGDYALFDASADALLFVSGYDAIWDDSSLIYLGTGSDVSLQFDGTNLELFAAAADTPFAIGGTTYGFDLTYYFETAGTIAIDYDGDCLTFSDDMFLKFGDSADVTMEWDSSATPDQFKIDAVTTTAGYAILIETTDGGMHLNADGAANGDITIDAEDILTLTSVDTKIFDGAAAETWIIEGTANDHEASIVFTDPTADVIFTFPVMTAETVSVMTSSLATNAPDIANSVTGGTGTLVFEGSSADTSETTLAVVNPTADNAITLPNDSGEVAYTPTGGTTYGAGAGALPLTHAYIAYTSTGADEALTLADGKPGQIITICHVTDGGSGNVTPATAAGFTTCELDDDGDTVTLIFVDTVGWAIMGTAGVAAPPALTVP